ncbi:hypothetical protein [Litorimonas sp.]|uniref:hypothetical protein n=1 Tax=Litorimonas sp. TaxID=1892381 RepID=UPI003A861DA1
MGDCIKQARAFVQGCHEALNRADDSCVEDMTGILADIQSGAKLNRARAIYRAAQDALQSLEDKNGLPLRLHALSNVVALYESGLSEMEEEEAQFGQGLSEDEISEDNDVDSADIISVDFSDAARLSRAKDAIKSALPYADDAQKQALEKLLAFPCSPPATKKILPAKNKVMTETKPFKSGIALESFIRDIIQTGLSAARQVKLTLSLSYDMAGVTLPEAQAKQAKLQTESSLVKLICHLAATTEPESLSHIDISASRTGMRLRTLADPMSEPSLDGPGGFKGISIEHDAKSDHLTLTMRFSALDGAKDAKPSPQKMPVEEGISSRLEALLESTPAEDADPFHLGAVL